MNSIIINAPAKINLFLKITGKRPDGYHDIETLFEKIALFDRISLRKNTGDLSLTSDNEALPNNDENLASKAVRILEKECNRVLGVDIWIKKCIPIGAGFGGGSSDAAAVLTGMNTLYELGLSKDRLRELAGLLGADVPFFISDKTWAVGTGRGDIIEEIDTRMNLWHILIIPPFSILSGDAYKWRDQNKCIKAPGIDKILKAVKTEDIEMLGKNIHNDLEGISFERSAFLKNLKEELVEYGAIGSAITGSGPALFGIIKKEEEVAAYKRRLEKKVQAIDKKWQVIATSTLSMN